MLKRVTSDAFPLDLHSTVAWLKISLAMRFSSFGSAPRFQSLVRLVMRFNAPHVHSWLMLCTYLCLRMLAGTMERMRKRTSRYIVPIHGNATSKVTFRVFSIRIKIHA
jgi:hypothetical protein